MAAPTLLDYASSNWTDQVTVDTTADLDWAASGNRIVVLGATEDNGVTLATPTGTGITLAAMSGLPTNTASSCKVYGFSATASGNGNTVLTSTNVGSDARGLAAWAWSGVSALGTPVVNVGAGITVNVTTAADSTVVMILADWNATTDVTVTTVPASGNIRQANVVSGLATFLVIEWTAQAAGTRAYGVSAWTGTGTVSKAAVEVLGISSLSAAIGRVSVAEAARSVPTAAKARVAGRVTETHTARPATAAKARTAGRVAVSEAARPVSSAKSIALGRVTVVETSRTLAKAKATALGRMVVVETARTLVAAHTAGAGRVTVSESARLLSRAKVRAASGVVSQDTARSVSRAKSGGLARVSVVETSRSMARLKSATLGRVASSEAARPLAAGLTVPVSRVTVAETGRSVSRQKLRALGRVLVAENARGVLRAQIVAVGRVSEASFARNVGASSGSELVGSWGIDIGLG